MNTGTLESAPIPHRITENISSVFDHLPAIIYGHCISKGTRKLEFSFSNPERYVDLFDSIGEQFLITPNSYDETTISHNIPEAISEARPDGSVHAAIGALPITVAFTGEEYEATYRRSVLVALRAFERNVARLLSGEIDGVWEGYEGNAYLLIRDPKQPTSEKTTDDFFYEMRPTLREDQLRRIQRMATGWQVSPSHATFIEMLNDLQLRYGIRVYHAAFREQDFLDGNERGQMDMYIRKPYPVSR